MRYNTYTRTLISSKVIVKWVNSKLIAIVSQGKLCSIISTDDVKDTQVTPYVSLMSLLIEKLQELDVDIMREEVCKFLDNRVEDNENGK